MKNKNYILVGIGELLWDIFPTGKKFGGAPANFAYHAQQLGEQSFVVSALGEDDLGKELLAELEKLHLNLTYISILPDRPTGTVNVHLDKKGVPEFIIERDVAWDYIPYTNELFHLAQITDAVCFGSLAQRSEVSHKTIRTFLKATPEKCLRVFDINLRQNFYSLEIIEDSLLMANCLKLNDAEFKIISDMFGLHGDENEILKRLLKDYDLQIIALTKGEKGSKLVTVDQISEINASATNVVDTVGAGDAFTAALVLGLLKNQPLDKIHKNAERIASYVCSQEGATPEIPFEIKQLFIK